MNFSSRGSRSVLFIGMLVLSGWQVAQAQLVTEPDYNKLIVMRYMEELSTVRHSAIAAELLSPSYREIRSEFQNMSFHAENSELAELAKPMRLAIPDRRDVVNLVMAEGDMVAVRYRIQGTHRGNFYGIPATDKSINIDAAALFWLADGIITDAWFMADEAGFLRAIGQPLPARKDGKWEAAPINLPAVSGDEFFTGLMSSPETSQSFQNKLMVNAYKSKNPPPGMLPETGSAWQRIVRHGFSHLAEVGERLGAGTQNTPYAFPDRLDVVSNMMAEGKRVMIHFRVTGTNSKSLHGIPALGRSADVWEIAFAEFDGATWQDIWFFGDELGMLLQLGGPQDFWFSSSADQ
jgi:steroid delta-isomerase-like uncharacterized protein